MNPAEQAAAIPPAIWAALSVLTLALAVSVVTDLKWRLILDLVTLPALALELGLLTFTGGREQLFSSITGVAVLWLPMFLASLPKRPLIGEGDAKLMAVVGAAAGWPGALIVIFWVSVAGGVQALAAILLARLRGRPKPDYVPYAVAIAAGALIAWTYGAP